MVDIKLGNKVNLNDKQVDSLVDTMLEVQIALGNRSLWKGMNEKIKTFDYSEPPITPDHLQEIFYNYFGTVKVNARKTFWCFSKCMAWTYPKKNDNTIWFNTRNFDKVDVTGLMEILIHEIIHIVDANHGQKQTFGHGDNYSAGKENSAPYFISKYIVKNYIVENELY